MDKEFAHYIAKLADLRMKSDKVDPKKLARNTQKYDETMIKLEATTENAIEMFTKAEEKRERLITKEFVAWQKAQHVHLSQLATAYQVCVLSYRIYIVLSILLCLPHLTK